MMVTASIRGGDREHQRSGYCRSAWHLSLGMIRIIRLLRGIIPCSRVRNGLNWIANPQNRWVKFSGVNEVEYENNVDYKLTQLHQDAIPKGIDVVDMSEENNKERYGA